MERAPAAVPATRVAAGDGAWGDKKRAKEGEAGWLSMCVCVCVWGMCGEGEGEGETKPTAEEMEKGRG